MQSRRTLYEAQLTTLTQITSQTMSQPVSEASYKNISTLMRQCGCTFCGKGFGLLLFL